MVMFQFAISVHQRLFPGFKRTFRQHCVVQSWLKRLSTGSRDVLGLEERAAQRMNCGRFRSLSAALGLRVLETSQPLQHCPTQFKIPSEPSDFYSPHLQPHHNNYSQSSPTIYSSQPSSYTWSWHVKVQKEHIRLQNVVSVFVCGVSFYQGSCVSGLGLLPFPLLLADFPRSDTVGRIHQKCPSAQCAAVFPRGASPSDGVEFSSGRVVVPQPTYLGCLWNL
jgi:hypothetical protein